MTNLTSLAPATLTADVAARAHAYVQNTRAQNTRRAYGAAWREFEAFCAKHGYAALPASPNAVIDYITALADSGAKASTISVKLAAIRFAHQSQATDPTALPAVRLVWQGIRRTIGTAQRRKAAVTLDDLRAMVRATGDDLRGLRDRALVLLGWAGAFRRSELAGLDVEDLHINGVLKVHLKRSKTDQEGAGSVKVIPATGNDLCPVAAMRAWLDAADIRSGAVFRSIDRWGHVRGARLTDRDVARIVKRLAEAAGLDPRQFSGHSLRAGFVTSAATAGVPEWQIQEVTGHKSAQVLRRYIRDAGRGQVDAIRAALGQTAQ